MSAIFVDGALCCAYIGLNAALNFVNRWALGVKGFSFPLTLTSSHMLLCPVLLIPLMVTAAYRTQHSNLARECWRAFLVIGVCNGVQISLNNSSLVHIELSMNQVVRATMPVFVALIQSMREPLPPLTQLLTLVVISLGVILVVWQPSALASELKGVALVASSVGLQAAQMAFSGSLLGTKLDSFQMTFYTSPFALLVIAGPAFNVEGQAVAEYARSRADIALAVLVGTCFLAVVYNVVLYQTIRRLSAIGSAVLGNVKVVVLLLLSSFVMGEMKEWSQQQLLGCLLTFGGAAAYSSLKLAAASAAKKPKAS